MLSKINGFFASALCLFLIVSCATYKNDYVKEELNWKVNNKLPDTLKLVHTVYLLGDAGESPDGEVLPAIKFFNKMLKEAPANSAAIILGDNIYYEGMPKKNTGYLREEAEHDLAVQLDGLKQSNFKGKPIIIMGNHDWGQKDPLKGLERQTKFIDDYLQRGEDVVFPKPGCGDPTTVELSEDLVVICLDSKWWIEDWNKIPDINDGCEVNSRALFLEYFADQISDHKGKNIIIALHHPPYTNGPHGGEYTWDSHLFPLRAVNKHLWIPMPVIGTVANSARASVGTDTDKSHPQYQSLMKGLIDIVDRQDSVIFVSGHEHTLQYFEVGKQRYIVSGSGAKTSPARAGKGALFTTGGYGHSVLYYYEDGSVYTEFYVANEDGESGELVYRKKVKGALPAVEEENKNIQIPEDTMTFETFGATYRTSVYREADRSELSKVILGNFNSDLYFAKVDAPVLYLDEHLGGLEIIKQGGSKQTSSLQLKDKNGRNYNLRSLRKDPTRSLPKNVNFGLAQRLMQYFFTGANPFGAFAVPDLAEAAGIYHTNPQLFYLPEQKALGRFNETYADQLYMLEERPDESWNDTEKFGKGKESISYRKLFKEIRTENDKLVKVNQTLALRNRLLDIMIGDFDRHLDQFRFMQRVTKDTFVYDPIPRDRDVAFSNWDGIPYRVGRLLDPFLRATHNYDDNINSMKWLVYQSRGFDDFFLNGLDWEDWEKEITALQANLTDEVLDKALSKMPKEIQEIEAASIKKAFQARRRDLMKYGREFYLLMNKEVEIVGTDNHDVFEVERLENGFTKVTAWIADKKGEKKMKFYSRTLDPDITKEILIYGMDKEDFFFVEGNVKKGIKVRLIGGYEKDEFNDNSTVKGWGKKTIINDDIEGKNIVNGSKETKDAQSDLNLHNSFLYLKTDRHFDYLAPFIDGGFNPDDGLSLGARLDYFTFPYRKTNVQTFRANYAFATKAMNFSYTGNFSNVGNTDWDFLLDARLFGPQFVRNYFGFGNDTELVVADGVDPDDLDFNRIRMRQISLRPSLKKNLYGDNYFAVGLIGEAIEVERTEGRLFDSEIVEINEDVFEMNYFAGIGTKFVFDFIDNEVNPQNGLRFNFNADWRANLQEFDRNFANFGVSLTSYNGWGEPRRLVLASKVGYSQNIGNYNFYHGVTLGGMDNLRGHRRGRFTGNSTLYHNTDLRYSLLTSNNNFIPFSVGVLAGFDYGRVWEKNISSDTWHTGYGGGFWISPVDAVVLNFSYFKSVEDKLFTFQIGYLF